MAASSLDNSTRDVPPTALGPAERVEQPDRGDKMRAADRAGRYGASAAERTPPVLYREAMMRTREAEE